jgi:hypothetical protein
MIGFMLLSTGALQAQDKPELEIGGGTIQIYPCWRRNWMDMMSSKNAKPSKRLNAEYRLYSEVFWRNAGLWLMISSKTSRTGLCRPPTNSHNWFLVFYYIG